MKQFSTLPLRISALFIFILPCAALSGQSYDNSNARAQLANLTQDVRLLSQKLGQLEVRMGQLERENRELKEQLVSQKKLEKRLARYDDTLKSSLNEIRQAFRSADEAQKKAIISAVSKQISELAEQTQKTIDALADYVGHQGSAIPQIQFSDDFPKTGIRYEVKPGDTIAKIASDHDVPVKDIINANQLANPDRIKVGQNLFIPMNQN